ncbi:MAG: aspartate/glutamate racemase family protein, partial [Firmicutes bacterium]|nr:aspartate/glutamate racemase family protein [Bacillota bacterium]
MLGIFDSGLGGLTALKEIRKKLPGEELVYFGDTGRVPYGTRSRDTIIKYAVQDMDFLMSFGPRAIIAACGTVSTTALPVLREKFDIPIIGVVEGAVERAAQITKNGIVGVIGTAATIGTNAFEKAIKAINPDI